MGKGCIIRTYHKAENSCTGGKPNGFQIPSDDNNEYMHVASEPL